MRFIGSPPGASPISYCGAAMGCVLPFSVTKFLSSTACEIRDCALANCAAVTIAVLKTSAHTTANPVINLIRIEISPGVEHTHQIPPGNTPAPPGPLAEVVTSN